MDIADYCECAQCKPVERPGLLVSRIFWLSGAVSLVLWAAFGWWVL